MKHWLVIAALAFTASAHAIDFTDLTEHQLQAPGTSSPSGPTTEDMGVGKTSKKGWRLDGDVQVSGQEVGRLGVDVQAPLFNGTKIKVRVITGVQLSDLDADTVRYKLGIEFEYRMKSKSFVLDLTNRYNPETKTFAAQPTALFGARFYF